MQSAIPQDMDFFGIKHTNIVAGASSTRSVNIGMNIWAWKQKHKNYHNVCQVR